MCNAEMGKADDSNGKLNWNWIAEGIVFYFLKAGNHLVRKHILKVTHASLGNMLEKARV